MTDLQWSLAVAERYERTVDLDGAARAVSRLIGECEGNLYLVGRACAGSNADLVCMAARILVDEVHVVEDADMERLDKLIVVEGTQLYESACFAAEVAVLWHKNAVAAKDTSASV